MSNKRYSFSFAACAGCDDIQVQTTMGIVRDKYLTDFDAACITLSRTVSSRFALSEPGKNNKRSIGWGNNDS